MKKIVDYNFNRQEQNIEICDSHFAEAVQTAEAKKEKEKKSERRMPRLSGGDERRGKGEPGELKHLSTRRKRKKSRYPE